MTLKRRLALVCALAAAGGCSGIEGLRSNDSIIPNETLNVSKSLTITAESFAAAALIFVIVDPLAPNWRIEETALDAGLYRLAMKKKRFTTGGDGEAAQIFYRRAAQLARERGDGRYRVVEFSEGVESSVLIAQRVAQGVIEVVPVIQAVPVVVPPQ